MSSCVEGAKLNLRSRKTIALVLASLGVLLLVCSLVILVPVFAPIIKEEVVYSTSNPSSREQRADTAKPVDPQFSIIIPKIGANAPVIAEVNPFNEAEYQQKLTKGVAHARGSVFPNEPGTTFLFAHSASNFGLASRYNAIFYLIHKLEPGDEIIVYYLGKKQSYTVRELRYVEESQADIMFADAPENRLVLMTCWPPGTSLRRLLVIAT